MRSFGLIGYPLSHSFSKKYFTEKFEKENLADCRYENYSIASIELLHDILGHQELEGLNITIPYKERVIPFLTHLSEEVKQIGACNCIKIKDGKLWGFNTDVKGFEQSLKRKLKPSHINALVLGTGGASKAIAYVLNKLGITFQFVSRSATTGMLQYNQLSEKIIGQHSLIINTSPVGTYPDINECPDIPYNGITSGHLLFDVVYNPAKSLFLQKGELKGAAIINGYEMLLIQADESWKIWNS
ncbi:MAG: shikimate dehydrogenase [Bacteroidetes bacterium]|nr:shikimate dehydrogenase [Bacteroidota bacterium]